MQPTEFSLLSSSPLRTTYNLRKPSEDQNHHVIEDDRSLDRLVNGRLPPSIWAMAGRNSDPHVAQLIQSELAIKNETKRIMELCGKFLYSSLSRAVQVGDMNEQTFVATGDIDDMWTRDSAVQIGIYMGRMEGTQRWLRGVVEGAIRRQAFHTLQDPYANAYQRNWVDPTKLTLRDRVIGRGGWVSTRNYELDSGAYFFTQLWDYYVASRLYKPETLLADPMIYDAVILMVEVWIVEQNHERDSPYRYFELPRDGKGTETTFTGMSWSGFRPSDEPTRYGYSIPSNIYAAAGLERILEINKRIWKSEDLARKARKLLSDIEDGIRKFGVVKANETAGLEYGAFIYAYEVDGLGNVFSGYDDANVPSLLSIPLLGWSGYDREVYRNTRKLLLSPQTNRYYFDGGAFRGIGSSHTPLDYVWPMAMAIEALTSEGSKEDVAKSMLFQLRQMVRSACNDAMHESVDSIQGCHTQSGFTRAWFEWTNALFVVLVETATGKRCDAVGQSHYLGHVMGSKDEKPILFYQNPYQNDHRSRADYYQGIAAMVPFYRHDASVTTNSRLR